MAGDNGKANGTIKFGIFEVDPRAGELRRNGLKVKLQEQPFQILAMLLEHPGEVVTREDLRNRLWPVDTFVDFDHGLNAAVKRLRDALGDSADNPRFVETLARRGYRFVVPVNGPGSDPAPRADATSGRQAWRYVLITALAAACISIGWHAGHRTARAFQPKETRLTDNSEDAPIDSGAISPDGKLLAYSDLRGLYVKQIATGETQRLAFPTGSRAYGLSWLTDGNHVLVTTVAGPREKPSLWVTSVFGGNPVKLTDDAERARVSPDGKQIAFLRGDFWQQELWLMNPDGSQQKKVAALPEWVVAPPVWSPDSKKLAYLREIMQAGYWRTDLVLEVIDPVKGTTETILRDNRLSAGLAWLPDWRILFAFSEGPPNPGDTNIWSLRIDERTGKRIGDPVRVTSGPDSRPTLEASADGKRLIFLRKNEEPAIYVANIDPKTRDASHIERLTMDDRMNMPYEWTPDGKAVLFVSNRSGTMHIYRQEPGAATPELVVGGVDEPHLVRLTPDKTEILYLTESGVPPSAISKTEEHWARGGGEADAAEPALTHIATTKLMRAPLSGGQGRVLLEEPGITNVQCARAPSRVCLLSQVKDKGLFLKELDPQTGATKLLMKLTDSDWEFVNWSLSPDGKLLATAKKMRMQGAAEIRLIPLRGGAERVLKLPEWDGVFTVDWAADGKSLWASTGLKGRMNTLINVDLQGHTKPIVQEGGLDVGWAISSQDGKSLALWQTSGGSNVWMLENF
jgi:Tol biopolymer transport system component/DNA-binding winged helix-turn-helix (wHTH) protein